MTCRVSPGMLRELHQTTAELEQLYLDGEILCQCQDALAFGDACCAPRLLAHAFEARIRTHCGASANSGRVLGSPLPTINACSVAGSCLLSPDRSSSFLRPPPLAIALGHMLELERFSLEVGSEEQDMSLAASLQLTCKNVSWLKLSGFASQADLNAILHFTLLKHLDLHYWENEGTQGKSTEYSARIVQTMNQPAFSHVRTLVLDLSVHHVKHLSTLTPLKSLSLMLGDCYDHELEPCLVVLAALTNLKRLLLCSHTEDSDEHSALWTGWSFLGALTGLTSLEIATEEDHNISSSDLLVLTVLTGLKELMLDIYWASDPSFQEGRPLPQELAFLGTATALEKLALTLRANYASLLGPPACSAVQDALHRLSRLTHLRLKFSRWEEPSPPGFLMLQQFSRAANLRSLEFPDSGSSGAEIVAPPPSLLSSLLHLRTLLVANTHVTPHVISLLDGINPPQLQRLHLRVDTLIPDLVHSIARFSVLRFLSLEVSTAPPDSLLLLHPLTSLTQLHLLLPTVDTFEEGSMEIFQFHMNQLRHEFGWPPLAVDIFQNDPVHVGLQEDLEAENPPLLEGE